MRRDRARATGDPDALIADADAAGYRAKAEGGGRVELSADSLTSDVIPDG